MRSNKGFTLIELLAVILILGIIALIAIPTVNSVIEQSRRGAAERSADEYINSVEKQIVINKIADESNNIDDGTYTIEQLSSLGVEIKGTMPDNSISSIIVKNDEVIEYSLKVDGYLISWIKDVGKTVNKVNETNKDISLVSDTNNNKNPDVGDVIKIGTEEFHVLSSDDSTVRMISKYNLFIGNYYDENNVYKEIEDPTGMQDSRAIGWSWDSINKKTKKPSYGLVAFGETSVYSGSNAEQYVKEYTKKILDRYNVLAKGSLITKEELDNLGCVSTDRMNATCTSSSYPWLYNTSYWTMTPSQYEENYVWALDSTGYFFEDVCDEAVNTGIRPVITISKNLIS